MLNVKKGERYGRLVVVCEVSGDIRTFLCKCDCGNKKAVKLGNLRRGCTKSCGCYRRELSSSKKMKHGHSIHGFETKAYRTWLNMKNRCLRKHDISFHNYGGRGITICDRWLSFENFLADMGNPGHEMTIERIDTNGNYEPGNCRWATRKEQARNTRRTHFLTYRGETKCVSEWEIAFNMRPGTLHKRLKYNWETERAIETPVRTYAEPRKKLRT